MKKIEEVKKQRAMKTLGIKHDQGKAPIGLLPAQALEEVAQVLAYGAEKYGTHNWRGGMAHSRLYDAALRHLLAFIDGQDLDDESGKEHLAHAICGLLMLLESRKKGYGKDDRYNKI